MSFNPTSSVFESTKMTDIGEYSLGVVAMTMTFTLLYGLFILLFFQFVTTFLQKGLTTRNQRLMFLASVVTFLSATALEGAVIARIVVSVHIIFFRYQDMPVASKLQLLYDDTRSFDLICMWASPVEVIISDGIVVWRAFVLLRHREYQRWIVLPFVLLLASAAMYLEPLISVGRDSRAKVSDRIVIIAIGLSLGANVVSTSFIGHIYWLHRKDMATWFRGERKRQTQGERVLAILVESGIVLCLFQIVFFVLEFFPGNKPGVLYAEKVFKTMYFGFVAIYPTAVIVLVNSHRTFDQVYFMETSLPQNTSGGGAIESGILPSMSFASAPSVTRGPRNK